MYALRFCPDCGHALPAPDRPPRRLLAQSCPACGAVHYRNAKPTASALVIRDGAVLLGRRAVEPARGAWDIPGGFLEPWEEPAAGAIREVAEETGLRIRTTELLAILVDTYAGSYYTLNVHYLAEVIGGHERAADDLAELRWFAPGELPRRVAFANGRRALALWRARLGHAGPPTEQSRWTERSEGSGESRWTERSEGSGAERSRGRPKAEAKHDQDRWGAHSGTP
jgi:ADP-ribose pyrophosphatase YjhB (NUDIX family)